MLYNKLSYSRVLIGSHPGYSKFHPFTVATFLNELADFLESVVLSTEPLIITGDFNIHVDVKDNSDSIKFGSLLESIGFVQHVNTPTHRHGHTLDLIITREFNTLVTKRPITDCFLSDHCTVFCELSLPKPSPSVKQFSYRKIKSHQYSSF